MRLRQRLALLSFVVAALVSFVPLGARAQFIAGDDLFLAPSSVPYAVYDPIKLSTGGSRIYSVLDVAGATQLLGVRILPLLISNPATLEGEYTVSDLAAITVANYTTYFDALPNADYWATTIAGNASTLTFNASGSYFVELTTFDGAAVHSSLFHTFVGDDFAGDPAGNKAGADRVIADPNTDLIVISSHDPPDNVAMANARKRYPNAPVANKVQDVCNAVKKYFDDHGKKKFSVTLIGHGNEGQIEFGTEDVTVDGRNGTTKVADFQKCLDPYVNTVYFYSCKTFKGKDGAEFAKIMRSSVALVGGWDESITIAETKFDAYALAKQNNGAGLTTPEPSVLLLFLTGLAATAIVARWRSYRLGR